MSSPSKGIRVVVVEDHPLFRQGLVAALEDALEISVVGAVGSVAEAREIVAREQPNVVLVDLKLPDEDGTELVRHFQGAGANPRVLVVSAHHHPHYVRDALACGAFGYLVKDEPADQIVAAVRGVAAGRRGWLSPAVARSLQETIFEELTPKEWEVVRRLAGGNSLQLIATELEISVRTVRNHLANVYSKLDLHSQSELVAWAWKRGEIF